MNLSIYLWCIYFRILLLCFRLGRKVVEFFGLGSFPGFLYFIPLSRGFFCRGFSWPPSVSYRYVSKTPLTFLDVFCDAFFTELFFRLSWSWIKRSGLLRHNKPEMLIVVICVLLGSLLLRTEFSFLRMYGDVITKFSRIDKFPYFHSNGVAPRARLRYNWSKCSVPFQINKQWEQLINTSREKYKTKKFTLNEFLFNTWHRHR